MRRRRSSCLPWVATALLAVTCGGCGESHSSPARATRAAAGPSITLTPAQATPPTTTPRPQRNEAREDPHEPIPERGGTIPAAAKRRQDSVTQSALSPTPQQALTRFGELYVNWSARTVRGHQLALAGISIGAARLEAEQVAARVQGNSVIGQDSVSNSGEVISVARGSGSASGSWVVVTREHTEGIRGYANLPSRIQITYAQLRHTQGGWVVSSWQPQH